MSSASARSERPAITATMRRREFVQTLLAGGAACQLPIPSPGAAEPPSTSALASSGPVRRVLVLFLCHLDVGFTNTQAAVLQQYLHQYFPQAIGLAERMRRTGEDRYIWTTGSWLLYEYLEWAKGAERARAERAIRRGDLAWQALPLNWQTEMLDGSLIDGALGLSRALDQRFGAGTLGAKMEDVPGHTRALVTHLAAHGVKLLDIGVNGASTVPDVPEVFNWQAPGGASLITLYHHGYGGVILIPGSDLAVAIMVKNDNGGPHSPAEVQKIYAGLRRRFPRARVRASNLSEIAAAVEPFRERFPAISREIGDTWIYGVASDPVKVAEYRELLRLRRSWLRQRRFESGDATDRKLLSRLLLAPEHTWGIDTKRLHDYRHYTPRALAAAEALPAFRRAEASWAEKRQNLQRAVAGLPPALRDAARARLHSLRPAAPDWRNLPLHSPEKGLETAHFRLALDSTTGAIIRLQARGTGREWASSRHPLAQFAYQTLSQADYTRYRAAYVIAQTWWAPMDFGKPRIERYGARHRIWLPHLRECRAVHGPQGWRLVAQMAFDDSAAGHSGAVAWPQDLFLELQMPDEKPVINLNFVCLRKPANRLPEAMWLSFFPIAPNANGWRLDKSGQWISPFEVVPGGNRHMHALMRGLAYQEGRSRFSLATLDAPVVALGERSPIYFSNALPDLNRGLHFSLFNNAWGTNYLQWFGENTRFRFRLRAS